MNSDNIMPIDHYHRRFRSRTEAERWHNLVDAALRGDIHSLRAQVKFELIPAVPELKLGELSYIADFVYVTKDGETVVEDARNYKRGAAIQLFKAKQKLMYSRYGLYVRRV